MTIPRLKQKFILKLCGSAIVILAGLFYLIYGESIEFSKVIEALAKFTFSVLACSFLLAFLQCSLQGLRLWILLPNKEMISLYEVMRIFAWGQVANTFLPARAGDFFKVATLSKFSDRSDVRVPIASAAGSVLVADKIVDLGSLILLMITVGSHWISELQLYERASKSLIHLFWVVPLLCLLARCGPLHPWLSRTFQLISQIGQGASALFRPRQLAYGLVIGCATWVAEGLTLMTISSSIGQALSFSQILGILVILNIGIAVPISIANLGAFEGAIVFGLTRFGVPLSEALAVAAVHHIIQIFGILALTFIINLGGFLRQRIGWKHGYSS